MKIVILFVMSALWIVFALVLVLDFLAAGKYRQGIKQQPRWKPDGLRLSHTVKPDKEIEYNEYWCWIKNNLNDLYKQGALKDVPKYNNIKNSKH